MHKTGVLYAYIYHATGEANSPNRYPPACNLLAYVHREYDVYYGGRVAPVIIRGRFDSCAMKSRLIHKYGAFARYHENQMWIVRKLLLKPISTLSTLSLSWFQS
jgi:hypothetical protein